MSYAGRSWLKLDCCRALLLVALPTACAVGVDPTFQGDGTDPDGTAGTSTSAGSAAGGTLGTAGNSALPKAGTTSTGGSAVANPFGGTASAGTSSSGGSSAGTATGGATSAGSSSGGSAGAAGKGSGGSSGAGAGGSGSGGCACPVKKVWMDNTNLSFVTNDCVDVAGALYLYTGAKPQTWANKDCNPTMQAAWCSDVGADYKFMLCK